MLKKLLLLALLAVLVGVLSGIASLVYQKLYIETVGEGFVNIASTANIMKACLLGAFAAAIGYFLLSLVLKGKTEMVFNILFVVLSIASILQPIKFMLPLEQESPELFPGLAVPMHFFPALGWFALRPFFGKSI
ncbi:hypothetical protein [Chitinophaga sp. S165]|uniref:hypothetical protein n=1 Tax=Chitinophaga sp. S165 TaxID=2135462 RepID=UPI000D7119BE|nr:hypothetical protein [Chitinophaga sp. S165]PWV46955.1 hypothetical protein C7475_10942 [Chitinophaga sp. S165]